MVIDKHVCKEFCFNRFNRPNLRNLSMQKAKYRTSSDCLCDMNIWIDLGCAHYTVLMFLINLIFVVYCQMCPFNEVQSLIWNGGVDTVVLGIHYIIKCDWASLIHYSNVDVYLQKNLSVMSQVKTRTICLFLFGHGVTT